MLFGLTTFGISTFGVPPSIVIPPPSPVPGITAIQGGEALRRRIEARRLREERERIDTIHEIVERGGLTDETLLLLLLS